MLTKTAEKFIDNLIKGAPQNFYLGEGLARVQVDAFISRVAKIYEKIRNAIDYKEEHLLRKGAIFRILQRRLLIKISAEGVGEGLLKELIRAGYLDNDHIPVKKIAEIDRIIEKYLAVFNLSGAKRHNGDGQELFKWLMEICACEIEESLMPPLQQRSIVEFMYRVINPEVNIIDSRLSQKEKDLYVYIAIYRALVKLDNAMIDFSFFKYYYPQWTRIDPSQVLEVGKKIKNLKREIKKHRENPLNGKLLKVFKKYTFVFIVLRDIILDNPAKALAIFNDPKELEYKIRNTCNLLYKKAKTKLRRSIVRVTIYIFITKMLLALLLEFPYDYYIAKQIFLMPLAINAIFPPFLMVFIATFIRVPSKNNTNKVVSYANEVLYQNKIFGLKGVTQTPKRKYFSKFIFSVLYLALFSLSFGVLIYILTRLNFNIFSIAIFIIFLSLISFFGIKLRYNIRDLVVYDKKEGPIMFFVNLFTLPFLNAGQWMSVKFSKINIFVFILDFIIEAPFKVFLEVIEDWVNFLKEKKEEIYNQQ